VKRRRDHIFLEDQFLEKSFSCQQNFERKKQSRKIKEKFKNTAVLGVQRKQ
jgi:hypothetical protein